MDTGPGESNAAESFSVYVHIPWCLSRCPYCDFNTYAAREWPEAAYSDALLRELAWYRARPPFRGACLSTVFFGGGTPSLFSPMSIERILDALVGGGATDTDLEVTLEANPGTVDRERFAGFRHAGVNRLSIGIQSFEPRLLERLGRRHSVEESRLALRAARAAGFDNLSIDLMYATPTQTLAELERDLNEAIEVAPEHVSAYALIYEPGTPLTRDLQAGRVQRTPEDLEATMFEAVRERLEGAGLPPYEISNHARPGRAARHNRSYWRGHPYLGLGAGAHSFAPTGAPSDPDAADGVRWQNARDPGRYVEKTTATGHALDEHEALTPEQAKGESCWLALRESRGLDPGAFARRFGQALEEAFPHVRDLEGDDLLRRARDSTGERLVLSPRGLQIADSIFGSFFG